MPRKPMIDTMKKPKYDILYTPEIAVRPLLDYLPDKRPCKVWECTDPGESAISRALWLAGFDVISSDVTTGTNFLTDLPGYDFDLIVTNPPYSLKNQFLARCFAYGKPFALLLPLTTLEGVARNHLFRKHGISLIVLDHRIDFTGGGDPWFAVGWFCWNLESIPNNSLFFEPVAEEESPNGA